MTLSTLLDYMENWRMERVHHYTSVCLSEADYMIPAGGRYLTLSSIPVTGRTTDRESLNINIFHFSFH